MPVLDSSVMGVVNMERDKPKHACHELAQDLPRALLTLWGNQLERLKEHAERQVNRGSIPFKHSGHLRLASDGADRN